MAKQHLPYECTQELRLERMEKMDSELAISVQRVCDKVDALSDKLDDALFPSEMHPNGGLIGGVNLLKKEMALAKSDLAKFNDAKVISNLETMKQEIAKAKVWISAVATIGIILFSLIQIAIKMFVK